jgi:hypothetical protein
MTPLQAVMPSRLFCISVIGHPMATSTALPGTNDARYLDRVNDDPSKVAQASSAVSWGAIAAGGAAAAALSLILLILGVGLGLSSVSPWSSEGMQAATFGFSTIAWLTLTQLLASALGGYLAGRLRTRWQGTQRDEVYFRDTAHGFLAWAVASLATAALLTSTIAAILGGGVQAGAAVVGGAGAVTAQAASARIGAATDSSPMAYFIDTLFRQDPAATGNATAASTASGPTRTDPSALGEVSRIFQHASRTQPLPPEDLRHVAQLVAQRTGLSQAEAEQRVSATYARAQTRLNDAERATRDAADQARKVSAYGALWLFVSLLVGAFVASWAATLGGQQRDR